MGWVEKYLNFFNFKKTVHILQLKILGTVAFALKLFMQKAY